jgi:hypothetical protein
LKHRAKLVRQSTLWRDSICRSLDVLHKPFKLASKKYRETGFYPHIHDAVELRPGVDPGVLEEVGDHYRERLDLPESASRRSYFHAEKIDNINNFGSYLLTLPKLIPGYDWDRSGGDPERRNAVASELRRIGGPSLPKTPRLIERMDPADVVSWLKASDNKSRMSLHGPRQFRKSAE